ncbi:MAG: hypothetical protein IKM19_09295 [Firmicutes bacterium]|nr:hypothetical protein [Bacillota bacterium]MBR3707154.1 hypothetical protein [Bacillota bacterium]MBR6584712.1 hypothetical protein [Bacillota bacterium]
MSKEKSAVTEAEKNKNVNIELTVDFTKIAAIAASAGVAIVGIVFGFKTYKKYLEWKRD